MYMVFEFMERGSLWGIIHDKRVYITQVRTYHSLIHSLFCVYCFFSANACQNGTRHCERVVLFTQSQTARFTSRYQVNKQTNKQKQILTTTFTKRVLLFLLFSCEFDENTKQSLRTFWRILRCV
jgi:hypothetical protein